MICVWRDCVTARPILALLHTNVNGSIKDDDVILAVLSASVVHLSELELGTDVVAALD